jgi:hypothetical protein
MVMVTGIMGGAAIAAITTVGTEAAGIIMDGTSGDTADGINRLACIKAASMTGAALIFHRILFSECEISLVNHRVLQGDRSRQHMRLRSGRQVFYRHLRRI